MATLSTQISEKIAFLPDSPGIYLWKDEAGEVIYVGKAVSLKSRIKSYLNASAKDAKTQQLLKHIAILDFIITNSEAEAFLLEATLIKRYQPKYNVLLKDDKRYPYVKITLNEPFPRVFVTRDLVKDGSRYFGPYTDVKSLRRTLRNFEWLFPSGIVNAISPSVRWYLAKLALIINWANAVHLASGKSRKGSICRL